MAGTVETLSAIAGDVKVVYGSDLIKVLPDAAIIQKRHKLDASGDYPAVGDYFSALVALQLPWGISFLGNGTENTDTNTVLNAALAGQTKPAKIYANMTLLRDDLAYFILDRAASSGSKQAVLSAMTLTGRQMAISARNVLEMQILHGRQGLGVVNGAIAGLVVTFDGATTAVGMISTLKGARVMFMQTNNTSARTATDTANYLTVDAVNVTDPAAPTITLVATGTTNVAAVTTGDILYIAGARGVAVASSDTNVPHYEQFGMGLQLSATTGSVFDIDKAAYAGWVANTIPTIGTFSPSVLMQAATRSMSRGGVLGEYEATLSVDQWGVLNSALATNEVYNSTQNFSMSKKTGTDEIVVYNGGIKIECIPHPFQKRGQFYMWPKAEFHRIGSTDLTFQIPGEEGGREYWFPIPDRAVMQRQCRADWQCALLTPPSGVIGTGVTY